MACWQCNIKDPNRYVTDNGPQCSNKCTGATDTFWVYLCQFPYENVIAMSGCCHDVVNFALGVDRGSYPGAPTITEVEDAHQRHITRVRETLAVHG